MAVGRGVRVSEGAGAFEGCGEGRGGRGLGAGAWLPRVGGATA